MFFRDTLIEDLLRGAALEREVAGAVSTETQAALDAAGYVLDELDADTLTIIYGDFPFAS